MSNINELNDKALEGVVGGTIMVMHIIEREDGKFDAYSAKWDGDEAGFLELFKDGQASKVAMSSTVKQSIGIPANKIEKFKEKYLGMGYKIV